MKRSIAAGPACVLLFATLVLGPRLSSCGGGPAYEGLDGEALYRRACMSCHGADGRAQAGGAPSYRGVAKDWTAEKLLAYVADPQGYKRANRPPRLGKRYMPPLDRRMPEESRRLLVEYVLGLMASLEVKGG